jgi:hypothetical protein
MASVEKYLQYAEQCVALAAKSSNPGDKARLFTNGAGVARPGHKAG